MCRLLRAGFSRVKPGSPMMGIQASLTSGTPFRKPSLIQTKECQRHPRAAGTAVTQAKALALNQWSLGKKGAYPMSHCYSFACQTAPRKCGGLHTPIKRRHGWSQMKELVLSSRTEWCSLGSRNERQRPWAREGLQCWEAQASVPSHRYLESINWIIRDHFAITKGQESCLSSGPRKVPDK